MSARKSSQLSQVQVLRALAASMVMVAHSSRELSHLAYSGYSDRWDLWIVGQSGVDLFFVISGFIMIYITERDSDASTFIMKRAARILPVYWFYTSLIIASILLTPVFRHHLNFSVPYAISSYLFVPWPRPGDGAVEPIYQLGWTLNYEVFFYMVFAAALLLFGRRGRVAIILLLVAFAAAGSVIPQQLTQLWYWSRPIIVEFAAGGLIAQVFLRGIRIRPRVALSIVVLGVGLLWFISSRLSSAPLEMRFLLWGGPLALVFAGAVLGAWNEVSLVMPPAIARFATLVIDALVRIGDSSYSLYLCHMFVIRLLAVALPKHAFGSHYWVVFLLLAFTVSYVVAWFSYLFIEKPSAKLARKIPVIFEPA